MDFSRETAQGLQAGLVRIFRTLQKAEELLGPREEEETGQQPFFAGDTDDPFLTGFVSMMDDDLNTAGAVGLIFEKIRHMNKIMNSPDLKLDAGEHHGQRRFEQSLHRGGLPFSLNVTAELLQPKDLGREKGQEDTGRIRPGRSIGGHLGDMESQQEEAGQKRHHDEGEDGHLPPTESWAFTVPHFRGQRGQVSSGVRTFCS